MDLIERQTAIDAIERNAYRHTYIDQIIDIIKALPSAQPAAVQIAYYKGMEDGIKKCTERLKRLNDEEEE